MLKVDIVHKTDVLVCGATSAAVAAALSAKERGVAVMAVSDRSYFGEDRRCLAPVAGESSNMNYFAGFATPASHG